MPKEIKSVIYKCTNPECHHEQTITYFAGDKILPVTCCVKCRAGFGKELQDQMAYRIGMFPTGKAA